MLKRSFNGFHRTFTCLHPFKSQIFYSTSSAFKDGLTNSPMVEYLVKSLGFSEDEAVSIAPKVSRHFQSSKKPELVVDFLEITGFEPTQIRKVVSIAPIVLHHDVEKNLKPKIRVFQELGLRGSDLGQFISQDPYLLNRSLEAQILPSLEKLKSVLGSNERLIRLLLKTKSQQWLLSRNVLKHLTDNLELLQKCGLPSEKIKQLMLKRPFLLMEKAKWLEKMVKGVEEKLGITPTCRMFVHGVSAMSSVSEDKLESLIKVYQSYGWSKSEISAALKRHPQCLTMSETMLSDKLKYFMEGLGFGSDYLATHPTILSYSMEKRILPRVAVRRSLMDRDLLERQISVYSCLIMAESKFVEKFVLPYKEIVPQLYESYTLATG